MFSKSIAILFLTAAALLAEPSGKSSRHARFLAVGDSPPFRQEIRGDVRYELDAPPGSLPPGEVTVSFGNQGGDAVPLTLGRLSPRVKAAPGRGIVSLTVGSKRWLECPRPESGDFIVFIWRNPAKNGWDDVLALPVPEGPAGTVTLTNLFPQAVRINWAGEDLLLPSGKSELRAVKPGTETSMQILISDPSGAAKRYYSGAITQNPEERGFVTIYRADGAQPRRPLKVSVMREPVLSPPTRE